MFRPLIVAAAVVAASLVSPVPVSAQIGRMDYAVGAETSAIIPVQDRRAPDVHRRRAAGGSRQGHGGGFPVGAGVAAGALIGGAILGGILGAAQGEPAYAAPAPARQAEADDYCASRFKSYDPSTGAYLGHDGLEHPCP